MFEWVKNNEQKNLILFVHGLTGGMETWEYDQDISFPKLLSQEESLDTFDFACFNYFTTFTNSYGKAKSWFVRKFKEKGAAKTNLPIKEIGELLKTEIEVQFCDYDNIIIIAHSMGGLISRSMILKQLEESSFTKVTGFISLAVPHQGAIIANSLGQLFSKNLQVKDLSVFSDAIDDISRGWIHAPNKPRSKYIYATHDKIVDKRSALSLDCLSIDSKAVNEDHTSICKPKASTETVCRLVLQYITEFKGFFPSNAEIVQFEDDQRFDAQYFVIKMAIADIDMQIQGHSKEYYYNAELIRKVFTSDADIEKLSKLYTKIKFVYQEEYGSHVANKTTNDALISAVHNRIYNEDNNYLNSLLSGLDAVHKKGMLHQLANKKDNKVIWCKNTNLNEVQKIKEVSE